MNFTVILNTVKVLALIVVALPEMIHTAERFFPEGGGAAKLAMVRAQTEALWNAASEAVGSFASSWPTIQGVIESLVGIFNKFGWLSTKE